MTGNELVNYINEYIHNGEIQGKAFITGEYREGNKAFDKMEKIVRKVEETEDKKEFFLTIFEKSKEINTLTCCCAQMLKLQIEPKLARKKLEEIVNSKEVDPVLLFNAKMLLKEWDNGKIKPVK